MTVKDFVGNRMKKRKIFINGQCIDRKTNDMCRMNRMKKRKMFIDGHCIDIKTNDMCWGALCSFFTSLENKIVDTNALLCVNTNICDEKVIVFDLKEN